MDKRIEHKVVEIEGCEYIETLSSLYMGGAGFADYSTFSTLTHKGNCKYCLDRNTK